jgi:hypothetical protein
VAERCPSICWTTFTSAPLAMARLARCGGAGSGGRGERRTEGADPQHLTGSDAGKDEVVGLALLDVCAELGGQECGDWHLASLLGLGAAPDGALSLHGRHRLGDDGAVAGQVEPGDPQCGHLAEPRAGVAEEEHDESVGLVAAGVEAAVLAGFGRVAGGEVVDLLVGEVAVLVLADPGQHRGRTSPRHARRDWAAHAASARLLWGEAWSHRGQGGQTYPVSRGGLGTELGRIGPAFNPPLRALVLEAADGSFFTFARRLASSQ